MRTIATAKVQRNYNCYNVYFNECLLFTHIHDYDEDYSCDLLELLPHNLKQKGIL